jgi:hypothetical protein
MIKKDNGHFLQMNDLRLFNFNPSSIIDLNKILKMGGIDENKLLQSTFYYVINTFCDESEIERARFISGMMREEFYYCPVCMNENPYHRLIWVAKDITVCTKHNIKLVNTCSHCAKEIRYNQIKRLHECPHCGKCFFENNRADFASNNEVCRQKWLDDAWTTLIHNTSLKVVRKNLATKLLYILNDSECILNKDTLRDNLINSRIIPTILQHARDSLLYKRTIHLSFLFLVLYERNISMKDFLYLEVPDNFAKSVATTIAPKKQEVACLAPWCINYNKKNTLMKTGTSYKRRKDDKVLLYYLACPECGCEYAFNERNELEERTYFIKSYPAIASDSNKRGLKKTALDIGLSVDQLRRAIAYFGSLGLVKGYDLKFDGELEIELLDRFIGAIDRKVNINDIKKWDCWNGYNHFLYYRYSIKVIKALLFRTKEVDKPRKVNRQEELYKLREILERMYDIDEDITLEIVSKKMGICVETLRIWGGNSIVEDVKSRQKEKRRVLMLEKIYDLVDTYIEESDGRLVLSEGLYKRIGISRTVLWRISREITSYIKERITKHNKEYRYTNII